METAASVLRAKPMPDDRVNRDRYAVRTLVTGLRPYCVVDDVTNRTVIEVADPAFARRYAAMLNRASWIVRLIRRLRGTAIVREEWKEKLDRVERVCQKRKAAR